MIDLRTELMGKNNNNSHVIVFLDNARSCNP